MHQYKRWVIFTAALFLSVSAALVSGPHLYFMAGMLLMLPLTSYIVGMFTLRGLEVSREAPASGWNGETLTFDLVVKSNSRIPRLCLQAEDHLPNHLDLATPSPLLFNALPGASTRIPYRVNLTKRGVYNLDWITITALDPLGMYAFPKRYRAKAELIVYPVPEDVPDIVLTGAERFGFRDLPFAAVRGSGVDPDGVREYVPGDPLRRMHWKSTARTGRLSVIEFEESRGVNVVLAVDLHAGSHVGTGNESTLEYLIRVAASLAQNAIRQGASARLAAGKSIEGSETGRGSDQLFSILAGLARCEATDSVTLSASLEGRVGDIPAGTTLVVLTSGLDDRLPECMGRYNRIGVRTVTVYADPRSFEPDLHIPAPVIQRQYLERLLGAGTELFVVRANPGEPVRPELYYDEYSSLS